MKASNGWVVTLVALALGGLCLAVCAALGGLALLAPAAYEGLLNSSSLEVGQPAPDFELSTLGGDTIRLSDFRGRPVLLSFGASWCPDCRRAAPVLQTLHEQDPQLAVLMVDVQEDRDAVQAYADEFGLTFPVALDYDGAVMQAYRVIAIPTELLIDGEGIVRARIIEQVTQAGLAALLEEAGIEP